MGNVIYLYSSSDDKLSTDGTMEVKHAVLQAFTVFINTVGLRSIILQQLQLGNVSSLKHVALPVLRAGTKIRFLTQVDYGIAEDRLWMPSKVHFDRSQLRDRNENVTAAKHVWENMPMDLETFKYLWWDAIYCEFSCGLGHLQNLDMFVCLDRCHYIGNFQQQEMIADNWELKLPEELRFCSKLLSLDFSYVSFCVIPEASKKLNILRRVDYIRSLNVMGCIKIVELPEFILRRLNTTFDSWYIIRLFCDFIPKVRGFLEGNMSNAVVYIPASSVN